ncbi:protein SEMI-ROLLED LEAF 2-like isoform X1 [Phoenix dactylifera]|uniref:Protein SEMI-ROLLED LEAF 2-like isoform X1 n=1 Tax=Phoenix dactylifera TaxID=42345 RepID=A0A8B9A1I1_PHODC|nr:protein SEMI-ROLLED LEAF 2-like isoform X1 [Phoenix dactylifera]XP_038980455.1 protein SEMI-ROLLED LEAF 2-like isoform X1 [Phoenix dactylifera]XP_038980456.1 protein SEMI-ROLLED LEAF 2-like isoform X1 [Phoenix dactylifera]
MGFMSRKILPACGNMCVCCPALRPSSRRPVKRYKKLLAEIFPKNLDGTPNERKIMKLCEYAAKNPLRIPKIAKFLEQRSYKELRSEHINFVKIITEAYSKLLYICKEQMAYFAISLLNVIIELLDNKQRDSVQILGCQTLTKFICSQADSTYARNIECLVRKVCVLAYRQGEEQKSLLQAASLQCLSAMIWFMTEYSYIFTDFDEIIHAILENYQADDHIDIDNERSDSHHNWVDEVVRSEARAGVTLGKDVNLSTTSLRPHSVPRDSAMLTREERESPEVWSQICVRKLAEMAKESTTMRCVLDPMLAYFDTGKHWASRHGLALFVLSDMTYSEKSSGNEQLILSAIIRHLDHKNVVHDPKTKSDIVQIATILVQHLRSQAVVAEIGAVSDLCRHLRKSLQTSVESAGPEESNWNDSLQNSIEDCLLEIVKGIGDARPLFDMMAITLEKMPVIAVVARATIGSLLILAHIISLTSIRSHSQSVFPEELLLQLLKAMMHPDVETRIVAHQIFSVTLVQNPNHPRHESEYLYETKKWQYRTTSVFASATALLEKLRREKGCLNADKHANDSHEEIKEKSMGDEEWKHGWPRKSSPYLYKLSCSIIDRIAAFNRSMEAETNIMVLTEDQTAQLLSAFWIQVNQADNLPSNIEAISHSFSLTLLFSRIKNSNHSNTVRFFQLPLSLRIASLDPNGMLSPSCQRSLFTLATGMLAFAGKSYHISELTNSLFCISSDFPENQRGCLGNREATTETCNIDPYLRVGDDLQIYVKSQSDLNVFGSDIDQQAATLILADLRKTVGDSDQHLFDIIVQELSRITDLEKDVLAKQLTETFTPEDVPLFGSMTTVDWVSIQALAVSEESLSFDEECSRSSTIDGDVVSESPATDIHKFIPRMPASPALPDVINVGQLLESALHVAGQVAGTSVSTSPLPYGAMASQCESLGMGTRKKLSSWLVGGHDLIPGNPASAYPTGEQLAIRTVNAYGCEQQALIPVEPRPALRLPPASPFDNFLKALYY